MTASLLASFSGAERQTMLALLQRVVSELGHRARMSFESRADGLEDDKQVAAACRGRAGAVIP